MPRYWVIAPYDSRDPDTWEAVWNHDFSNGVIAIGWGAIGDVSSLTEDEIFDRVRNEWPESTPRSAKYAARTLHIFYNKIAVGDKIIARRGLKIIAGIGIIRRTGYFDPKGLNDVFDQAGFEMSDVPIYPHQLAVDWSDELGEFQYEFEDRVFGMQTLHELSCEKYESLMELDKGGSAPELLPEVIPVGTEIVLEKYLEDFIVSNFSTIFQNDLKIYTDPENGQFGQQYRTSIGIIDVLARYVSTGEFVVIELKRGREADKVVGQVLRYMGWVAENLCDEGQEVHGMIICKESDPRLSYAIKMVKNVSVKYYQVGFKLLDAPSNQIE